MTPAELVDELRALARTSAEDVYPAIRLVETIEWEAADFIAAVRPLLDELSARGGEIGERAKRLLACAYETTPEADA